MAGMAAASDIQTLTPNVVHTFTFPNRYQARGELNKTSTTGTVYYSMGLHEPGVNEPADPDNSGQFLLFPAGALGQAEIGYSQSPSNGNFVLTIKVVSDQADTVSVNIR